MNKTRIALAMNARVGIKKYGAYYEVYRLDRLGTRVIRRTASIKKANKIRENALENIQREIAGLPPIVETYETPRGATPQAFFERQNKYLTKNSNFVKSKLL